MRPYMIRWARSILAAFGVGIAASASAGDTKIVADVESASRWIAAALASSGYRADYTLWSLKEIDRFFDEQAPDGQPKSGGLLSESLGTRLFGIGSYVGEVIRRQAGGSWHGDDSDPSAEINVSVRLGNGATIWPIQRVMKRFKEGPEQGIYVYGSTVIPH